MAFTSIPFVVRTVQPVLEDLPAEVDEAAMSLGATDGVAFRRVIMPHLWPALVTGTGLAFVRSLGEFGAIIFIAGNMPYETEVFTALMILSNCRSMTTRVPPQLPRSRSLCHWPYCWRSIFGKAALCAACMEEQANAPDW